MSNETKLSTAISHDLLKSLSVRFEKNMNRHKGIKWESIREKLEASPDKLWSLGEMERTGGEPDVFFFDEKTGEYVFCDCSAESPSGRLNTCYDGDGQEEREKKGINPSGNAVDMASYMGIELLSEADYHNLQKLGSFDTKTSSWIKTPADIRKAGGALFADRRYGHVFIYHNSAPSFYSARGFRGLLRV